MERDFAGDVFMEQPNEPSLLSPDIDIERKRKEMEVVSKEEYESGLRFIPDYPKSYISNFKFVLDLQLKRGYGEVDWVATENTEYGSLLQADKPFIDHDLSLSDTFRNLKPEYPPNITAPKLEIGSKFHTKAPGCDPSCQHALYHLTKTPSSMYALICCFLAPYLWDDGHLTATRAAVRVFKELCSIRNDVLMLVVVKMRTPWINDSSALEHFKSFFPSECLFLTSKSIHAPFHSPSPSSPLLIDVLCKYLNLDSAAPTFAFVDPDNTVLQHGKLSFFNKLTADCFPFTSASPKPLPSIFPSQLRDIFALKPSTVQISKLGGGSSPVPLSKLEGKHVALYLCRDGFFIPELDKAHQECLRLGPEFEFEIVLVYMGSLHFHEHVDEEYVDIINEQLLKRNLSWWIVPSMEWVTHWLDRFERLFTDDDHFTDDRVIMVGPHGRFVDPYAKSVILWGADFFPFTRDRLISKLVEELENLELLSLLARYPTVSRVGDGLVEPLYKLQDMNVILYIDYTFGRRADVLDSLVSKYPEIKKKDPNCKVVFLPMDPGDAVANPPPVASEWLTCPFILDISSSICKDLLSSGPFRKIPLYTGPTLVAFGKNGRISSLRAHELLQKGVADFPLKGDLRSEVIAAFDEDADYMHSMRCQGVV